MVLCDDLRNRDSFEIEERAPDWAKPKFKNNKILRNTFNVFGKMHEHLWGKDYLNALAAAREKMNAHRSGSHQGEAGGQDHGRVLGADHRGRRQLPHVRVPGAGRRAGDGRADCDLGGIPDVPGQGARQGQVAGKPSAPNPQWWEVKKHLANDLGLRKKLMGIGAGEKMWNYLYHRTIKNLGGITHHLVPQTELAEMAHPFYNQFARGGEGHLEVGKNVYYTVHHLCHMVLALKPFGCMPSSQSDGVQSAVMNKFKDMIFLPIETSGEGEVNAHSRVQMALGEAKVKAKTEFEQCLKSTGKSLEEIREYIAEHPELKRPFYHVPHREGVAGRRRSSSCM